MAHIEPLSAFRYDPASVDLARVLARAEAAREGHAAPLDPRHVSQLDAWPADAVEQTRARFFWADWVRAGVLRREDEPVLYLIRQSHPQGEWEQLEVLGHLSLTADSAAAIAVSEAHEDNPGQFLPAVQSAPVTLLFHDEQGRVTRRLENEMEECDPDVHLTYEGVEIELWVLEDETTLGRLCAQLAAAPLTVVDGHALFTQARAREAGLLVALRAAEGDAPLVLRHGEPMETVAFTAAISDEGPAPAGTYALAHPLPRGLVLAPLELS